MVFYLIGLGLSDPEDISLKGLKAVQSASRVYLEMYTGKFWNSYTEQKTMVMGTFQKFCIINLKFLKLEF